ncbi:hypothetical protein [Chenggangzhangella methanolivorans]|uniref:Uncharacterized protein n=1 Tax=Chenggangzhangella methanolivorans TaxID=1437009 RepID=A0A9E6UM03_9HYPH|nr:hypothetical protein [Chenggangzhangella methanolivorans]QZN99550.1 hypothetical protein K6K41_23040 [Chenggangzhangella methanolivorans]
MALTNVRSDLLSQIGLQPPFAFDLMRRDEVSRTPNGQSITTELGWPLWKLAFTTSERNFGDVVRQQAILNHLASVGNLFYAHDVRRPFPGAYPSGFDLANPIYNPEFEDGLTGWVVSADCQITNDGRGGSKCVQLDKLLASGGSDRRVQNDAGFYVNVTANEPYDFSVYIKSNVETTTGIRLAVNFYDVSGHTLARVATQPQPPRQIMCRRFGA